jgi:broad specificity phosphatase PhoE
MVRYPRQLALIRHAESAGNVANDAALRSGLPELDLAQRDMDVPLSPLGEAQADALGTWFARRPAPPDVVLCSPYRRALDTGARALAASGIDVPVRCDERLREREFGVLDRLTKVGIEQRFPEQAAARAFIGKFFHRPPGGESWSDVAGRVRSVLTDLRLDFPDGDVVIVTHQAVIMLFRYVLDRLNEEQLLALDASEQIANTAVTTYASAGDGMELTLFNDTSHLPAAATTDAGDRSPVPR